MTPQSKFGWGIGLNVVGGLLLVGGLALSFTLIGACAGVPMAIVGLPMAIWGAIWTYQGHHEKQTEAIAAGIRDGITASRSSAESLRPPALPPVSSTEVAATEGSISSGSGDVSGDESGTESS